LRKKKVARNVGLCWVIRRDKTKEISQEEN